MNVLIITTGQYPNKHASSVRHSTIAKGLANNGCNVEVFVVEKQNWQDNTIMDNNVLYHSVSTYSGNNRIFKKLLFALDIKILGEKLKQKIYSKDVDAVLCFTSNISVIKKTIKICKSYQVAVFHERTELPYVFNYTKTWLGKIKYKKYINKYVPQFNGIFVISDKLNSFFKKYNPNTFKILTVVDTEFFNTKEKSPYDFEYLAYCGNLSGDKDGLPILIEAFAKLSNNYSDYKLVLIGKNDNRRESNNINIKLKELNLEEKVIFTGFLERNKMPRYLSNAKLLVVSKPDNEQNSGNFPIKVGEYLATGVPVVLTKVGEIPIFLKDGMNGYLADPDSPESFYNKMKEALTNYERAIIVGRNGKILAESIFDYKIQSKLIVDKIKETTNKLKN